MIENSEKVLLLPFGDSSPRLAGAPVLRGTRAAVLGRIEAGRGMTLGEASLIRADGHFVRVGEDFWVGDYATVHIAHEIYPTLIGDRVTVGTNAVVHACTVASDCVIEDDVVILDGSVVGEGVVVTSGSIVFPRSQLLRHGIYSGRPAKRVGEVTAAELEQRAKAVRFAPSRRRAEMPAATVHRDGGAFVAATARTRGKVFCEDRSSIWFSCDVDAGEAEIHIGAETNVQDNTIIRASRSGVVIGSRSVVGHNVTLEDCTIGARSLIGIGSFVAAGTVVEDDVLLAAGARTEEKQILASGWLWGSSPARKLAALDEEKKRMITWTVDTYRGYAADFTRIQSRQQRPFDRSKIQYG